MEEKFQISLNQKELESLVDFVDTHYDEFLSKSVYSKIIKLFEESIMINREIQNFTYEELKHIEWAVRYLTDMYYHYNEESEIEYKVKNITQLEKSIFSKIKNNLNVLTSNETN